MSRRELMRVQIETLFTHGVDGRMARVNEPGGRDAPLFFLGRTVDGNVWRFRHDVSDDLQRDIETACLAEPVGDEFIASPYGAAVYENILMRGAAVHATETGPAYFFPRELDAPADVVPLTDSNRELLRPHLESWIEDSPLPQPAMAVLVDGRAVSICCSVRIGAVAHEAGVDTAKAFRGRGYAARVVAAWAIAVRQLGRIPFYSTSWNNVASQAVARRLQLVRFGTDLHIG